MFAPVLAAPDIGGHVCVKVSLLEGVDGLWRTSAGHLCLLTEDSSVRNLLYQHFQLTKCVAGPLKNVAGPLKVLLQVVATSTVKSPSDS